MPSETLSLRTQTYGLVPGPAAKKAVSFEARVAFIPDHDGPQTVTSQPFSIFTLYCVEGGLVNDSEPSPL